MVSETDRQNWREAFEKLGPATLRVALNIERAGMLHEYVQEAYSWLREQDAIKEACERKRYRTILGWTIAAAVASIIAAATGIITVGR